MFGRWVFASVKGLACWFTGVFLLWLVASSSPAESKKELRVGYQKSGALLLTKTSGLLEKALAPLGYTVVWREFPSGSLYWKRLTAGA
jgi:sulfonate transport system substrate-binding protein